MELLSFFFLSSNNNSSSVKGFRKSVRFEDRYCIYEMHNLYDILYQKIH